MPDKTTSPTSIEPVRTTVVGVGETSPKFLPSGTIATTPGANQPNVVINVVSPIVAILVRFVHNYITALLTLVSAGVAGAITATDFSHLVMKCAGLALAGPSLMLLKDVATIFGKLEERFPLLTGNV